MKYKSGDAELVQHLTKRLSRLEEDRRPYNAVWDEVTEFVLPSRGTYAYKNMASDPERKSRRRFDPTPVYACRDLTSKIISNLTGTADRWFDYRVEDPQVDGLDPVRRSLQKVSDRAYSLINDGSFRMAHVEATTNWVAYGTGCILVTEEPAKEGEGPELDFQSIHPLEIFIAENKVGEIDTVYRKYKLTYRQAEQVWGYDNLPEEWLEKLAEKPDDLVELVHCVMPNKDYKEGKLTSNYFKFKSFHFSQECKHIISVGGFKRNPYYVFRFWKRSNEVYGGSPAIDAMADIRVLNLMEEANTRMIQLEGFPPIAVAHDSVIAPMRIIPNGINYGGISADGRRLVDRLLPASTGLQAVFQALEQKRQSIRTAFFVDPRMNADVSIRTAAEVAKRANEELVGITPFINRYQAEYLSPVLDHVLDFVLRLTAKTISIPVELHGHVPQIEYTAPLAKTQRAQELNNTMQFLQVVQSMAQADPSIMQRLDQAALFERLADLFGVPFEVIVPPEVMAQREAMQQQQMMQQQVMQQVGQAGGLMNDMAKSGLINRDDLGIA